MKPMSSTGTNSLTHDELITTIARTSSFLSIAGTIFVISCYVWFREYQRFSRKLILLLNVADLFLAITFAISTFRIDTLCQPEALGIQFFYMASCFWTAAIAFHLRRVICQSSYAYDNINHEPYFHLVCWGVPAAVGATAYGLNQYNQDGAMWCWIRAHDNLPFYFFYLPVAGILLYNVFMYVFLIRRIQVDFHFMADKAQRRLLFYVLVFILCMWAGVAYRICQAMGYYVRWLQIADSFLSPLQGFCNALVYSMNKTLRMNVWACFFGDDAEKDQVVQGDSNNSPSKRLSDVNLPQDSFATTYASMDTTDAHLSMTREYLTPSSTLSTHGDVMPIVPTGHVP